MSKYRSAQRTHQQEFVIEIYDHRDDSEKPTLQIIKFTNHKEYLRKMSWLASVQTYTVETTVTKFRIYKEHPQTTLGF